MAYHELCPFASIVALCLQTLWVVLLQELSITGLSHRSPVESPHVLGCVI